MKWKVKFVNLTHSLTAPHMRRKSQTSGESFNILDELMVLPKAPGFLEFKFEISRCISFSFTTLNLNRDSSDTFSLTYTRMIFTFHYSVLGSFF